MLSILSVASSHPTLLCPIPPLTRTNVPPLLTPPDTEFPDGRISSASAANISCKCGGVLISVKGSLANAIYRTTCSRWSCPRCAAERQAIAATGIAREIIKHKMRSFLTLTLPSDYSGKRFIVKDERNPDRRGIYRRLAQDVNLFLTRLRQKHPDLSFIRVIERNLSKKLPHIHLVISPKTSTSAVSEIWHSITGGTAHSKPIQLTPESATRLGAYMSKQLCNSLQLSGAVDA